MVGIVLVSHSRALAVAVQEMVRSMTGPSLPLAIAAGVGDQQAELGTDAVDISEAILSVKGPEGVLLLMDMGSAILSAETAVDLLDRPLRENIRFCAAPFVEGAVAAGVTANLGASLEEVYQEALAALNQKKGALNPHQAAAARPEEPQDEPADQEPDCPLQTVRLTVRNPHGLHARPAARLISETRPFHSDITLRNLTNERGPVSVKSLSRLASLEILHDHEIEVSASGDDATAALEKISLLVKSGLGDTLPSSNGAAPRQKPETLSPPEKRGADPVPVSDGIAIGPSLYFEDTKLEIPAHKIDDVGAEIDRLNRAVAQAQKAIETRQKEMSVRVGASNAGIYEAQILALQDPELTGQAIQMIRDKRANAALAWDLVNQEILSRYESLEDPYLRERAADLEDVGRQVLELLAVRRSAEPAFAEPSILIADDLTPHQISALPQKSVLGVILLDGGPTAHSSILLKALGLPAVVRARARLEQVDLRQSIIVAFDGSKGIIWLQPSADFLAELQNRQAAEHRRMEEETKASSRPGATLDGHAIEIFANLGHATEVDAALHGGAEGVGLLRTEFLFLARESAPTEDEQVEALRAVASKMEGKPVIVRTLDAGGDKKLPYLQMPSEANPFLGVRAIRLCFSNEELFTTQLRAILRAGHGHDFRLMFPMIAHVCDLSRAKECLEKAHRDLEQENIPHLWPIPTGIMIEIPSAALQAECLAEHADFFSIGTNDLTQYALAADRGNPELAAYQDAAHPAVLRLVQLVVAGADKHNRPVAVCGEAASDEVAAGIFIGLGVRELSMTSAKISRLKAFLSERKLSELQHLAEKALRCQSAAEVRQMVTEG
jgi:phosphoenolpyruvate-protein phosphotransferase/dihydroxyacetone kinase phosphotransfer subunit